MRLRINRCVLCEQPSAAYALRFDDIAVNVSVAGEVTSVLARALLCARCRNGAAVQGYSTSGIPLIRRTATGAMGLTLTENI